MSSKGSGPQPHPTYEPEHRCELRPPRDHGPQPGPKSDSEDRMPSDGDLIHLGWKVNSGNKRPS